MSKKKSHKHLEHLNINAAGIDIGARSHFVAVPEGRDESNVREFQTFTEDLNAMVTWLKKCGIETVAMESTGVYWIPVYELLEEHGFEVLLVNAHHVKNVSGRKSDVLDCQWIQQLHTYGLLSGAFRPSKEICEFRGYMRQRECLVRSASSHIQHMQKALDQMNLRLHNAISDITGKTGKLIINAIISGERDRKVLAQYRDGRCKNPIEIIEKSLEGSYKAEHLFALKQAMDLFEYYQQKIAECDVVIENLLEDWTQDLNKPEVELSKKRKTKSSPKFDAQTYLYQLCGVNLMAVHGIDAGAALKIISEIGLDMSKWKTEKHFGSWLGVSPGTKVSGGKILSRKSKSTANRVAVILRLCANSLYNSQTALGSYLRRMKGRIGAPKAITATAYKLAKILYLMLKNRIEYEDVGQEYYEERYQDRLLRNLKRKASSIGYVLIDASELTPLTPATEEG